MDKVYLLLVAFFMFSCSSSDDTTVVEEEDLEPIEEPTEPKVYKLKKKTFDFDSEYYTVEREVFYEYGVNGFVSKIDENQYVMSGNKYRFTTNYYYTNNTLDSIVNNNMYSEETSATTTTIFNHDSRGFITDDVKYFNGNLSETNEYFYSNDDQLEYIVRRGLGSDGTLGAPTTQYLIYENGILVGYESNFPTTRTFDDKNNPEINLYSPDYKRIVRNLFIHNILTQVSTSSSVKRKYEYEYNSDDFPVKSFNYENDKFVFETNYIYY